MKAKEVIEGLKIDYALTFGTPAGQRVLRDLMMFCRVIDGPFVKGDPDETMMLVGCQEVWRHITMHINMTPDQLFAIYTKQQVNIGEVN